MHKLDANISGKSEKSDYLISAGYVNQAGILLDSDYKKYSLSLKLNTHINKYLDVGGNMSLNYGDQKRSIGEQQSGQSNILLFSLYMRRMVFLVVIHISLVSKNIIQSFLDRIWAILFI